MQRRSLLWGITLAAACVVAGPVWAGGGTLTGKVVFKGTPPTPAAINFGGEKQCALMHGDQPPKTETLVVNPDGTLKWVLVRVSSDVAGPFTPPTEPVVINQRGCVFLPHAAGVQVGQPVTFQNDDALLHNVRAQSKLKQSFNIAQPKKDMKVTKTFARAEIGIPVKCDVHFWMVLYLHVLPHPFFAITGDDGRFALTDLPAGTYTIEAWHESLGTATQSVTLGEGETKALEFSFGS